MFNGCIHSIPIFSIIIFCEQLAEFVRCSFFQRGHILTSRPPKIIIFVLQKRAKSDTGTSELGGANVVDISTVASLGIVRRPTRETYDPYKENAQSTISITLAERGYIVARGSP